MDSSATKIGPLSLFYSYSHRDEAFRRELGSHLAFLKRSNLIAEWHDRMIGAGDDWKGEIDRNLASADIVLLLVSSDFIASDYCWGEEMTKALTRHDRGEARVIPVILRRCRWASTPLARLQAVPKDAKPVSEWTSRDAAFDDIAIAIERTIAGLREQRRCAADEEARQRAEAEAARAAPAEAPSPGASAPPSPASGRGSTAPAEGQTDEQQKPLPPGEVGTQAPGEGAAAPKPAEKAASLKRNAVVAVIVAILLGIGIKVTRDVVDEGQQTGTEQKAARAFSALVYAHS